MPSMVSRARKGLERKKDENFFTDTQYLWKLSVIIASNIKQECPLPFLCEINANFSGKPYTVVGMWLPLL